MPSAVCYITSNIYNSKLKLTVLLYHNGWVFKIITHHDEFPVMTLMNLKTRLIILKLPFLIKTTLFPFSKYYWILLTENSPSNFISEPQLISPLHKRYLLVLTIDWHDLKRKYTLRLSVYSNIIRSTTSQTILKSFKCAFFV